MVVAGLGSVRLSAAEGLPAGNVRILTSFYPMYIATLNVTKGVKGVEVANLTRPQTGCLHDYQMTTEDMRAVSGADILVVNGAGMESFLDKVIKQYPKLKIIHASEGVELIKEGDGKGGNPHVWVSVSSHIRQIGNIAGGLARLDPSRAVQYRDNAAAYTARLEALRDRMREELKGVKTREIVTFHEAFPYLAKELELNIAAVIERDPGSEPTAAELVDVIKTVKSKKVKALFAEPQYSSNAAAAIARETAATVYTLDPAVTGPDNPDAYIKIMEGNLVVLKKALGE